MIIFGILLAVMTLPGTIELCLLSLGVILEKLSKKSVRKNIHMTSSFIVIIPAHNEEKQIARTIRSLQACDPAPQIVVIADNCTDATETIAKSLGTRVLVRNDAKNLGKHYALKFAFECLLNEDGEYFVIVDADSWVKPNFIRELKCSFEKGSLAVQAYYQLTLTRPTPILRLMRLAFENVNHLRPLGRKGWGLSVGIYGNGFALHRTILEKVPFHCITPVEDLEYHLALVSERISVHFSPEAIVYTMPPEINAGFKTQRSRWEGGRLNLLLAKGPILIKQILKGNGLCLEPLLDLMLLPLSFHFLFLLPLLFFSGLIGWYGRLASALLFIYLIMNLLVSKASIKDLLALLVSPYYVIWKISLLSAILQASHKAFGWRRTER